MIVFLCYFKNLLSADLMNYSEKNIQIMIFSKYKKKIYNYNICVIIFIIYNNKKYK